MREGLNQYPPMAGVPALRQAVARKIEALYGRRYDADTEITVTAGATQAILTAVLCCVHPGDEVIVLEPCYDSYGPNIELAGGTCGARAADAGHLPARLRPHRRGHHAAHARHHRQLAAQPHRHGVDARRDAAAGRTAGADRHPADQRRGLRAHGLRRRAACQRVVDPGAGRARLRGQSSFGKTYHVTGWKVGTWRRRRR
jgi:methionine aminotransferase